MKSLEQERAKFAFECVQKVTENNRGEYRALVRSFPIMIHNNGFGAAISLLYAKKDKKSAYDFLYDNISDWLGGKYLTLEEGQDLMEVISTKGGRDKYKLMANETMAFLKWLKRFAEGGIPEDEESGE